MESACYRTSNTALPDGGGADSKGKMWLATSTSIPRLFVYFQTVWVCPSEEQRGEGVSHTLGGDPRPTCSLAEDLREE